MSEIQRLLLEQIDALRDEGETVGRLVRKIPEVELHRDVGAIWGSIFGTLGHIVKDQDFTLAWLGGNPRGPHDELRGTFKTLDEYDAGRRDSDRRLFEAVKSETDMHRLVRYWFPEEDDWYQHRFYQVVQFSLHHSMAHLAHVYIIARLAGYELTQNALFYYYRHPPKGAYCLADQEIYGGGFGARCAPPADYVPSHKPLDENVPELVELPEHARRAHAQLIQLTQRLDEHLAADPTWRDELRPRLEKATRRFDANLRDALEQPAEVSILTHVAIAELDERSAALEKPLLDRLQGRGLDPAAKAELGHQDVLVRRFESPNLYAEVADRLRWRARGVPREIHKEAYAHLKAVVTRLETVDRATR